MAAGASSSTAGGVGARLPSPALHRPLLLCTCPSSSLSPHGGRWPAPALRCEAASSDASSFHVASSSNGGNGGSGNQTLTEAAALLEPSSDTASPSAAAAPANGDSTELLRSSALDIPPPSLINYANIQRALAGEAIPTPDHYGILGLRRGASYDEVRKAFEFKCESVLSQGLDEEATREQLLRLKDSYHILSTKEERRLYDWSLAQSESPANVYQWPYEADITQSEYPPAPPLPPEDEEPTRRLGYFFLGWILLSIVLSAVLKR